MILQILNNKCIQFDRNKNFFIKYKEFFILLSICIFTYTSYYLFCHHPNKTKHTSNIISETIQQPKLNIAKAIKNTKPKPIIKNNLDENQSDDISKRQIYTIVTSIYQLSIDLTAITEQIKSSLQYGKNLYARVISPPLKLMEYAQSFRLVQYLNSVYKKVV
ncbi:hypothetical protein AB837_00041 [bacterium AB1]|nr:hypothetical protein AB837_00041 [bacterium AB1]